MKPFKMPVLDLTKAWRMTTSEVANQEPCSSGAVTGFCIGVWGIFPFLFASQFQRVCFDSIFLYGQILSFRLN